MKNAVKQLFVSLSIVVSTVPFNVSPASAGSSPFQDFLKYKQIIDGSGNPAELTPYVLPAYRAKYEAKNPEEKELYCKGARTLLNLQNIKLRSESKAGNEATVIFDCQGMGQAGVGSSTMSMQPIIAVVTMTNSDGNWVTTNVNMKRPEEFAAMGTTTAGAVETDKQWCAAGHKVAVPNKPLTGTIQGSPFILERADLNSFGDHSSLNLRIADTARFQHLVVYVNFVPKGAGPVTYTENTGAQQVQFSGHIDGKPTSLYFDHNSGFMISMQKLPLKDGNYPIYLVMRLPDNKHTELKGYLYAKAL